MTLTFDDARARAERAVEAGSDAKHRSRRGASRRARLLAASVHGTAHELRATLELALWPNEPGTQTIVDHGDAWTINSNAVQYFESRPARYFRIERRADRDWHFTSQLDMALKGYDEADLRGRLSRSRGGARGDVRRRDAAGQADGSRFDTLVTGR